MCWATGINIPILFCELTRAIVLKKRTTSRMRGCCLAKTMPELLPRAWVRGARLPHCGAAANRTRVHGNFGRDRNCTDSGMCPVCCKCVSLRKLLPVHTAARLLVPMTKPFSPIKPQERFELPSTVYRTIVLPLHYWGVSIYQPFQLQKLSYLLIGLPSICCCFQACLRALLNLRFQ